MANSVRPQKNLTEGAILPQIIKFSLPLIATAVLNLLFNTADTVVVGRWGGDTPEECEIALGAVGSCGALINLIVNLFMGLSVGAGVAVAHDVGAEHYDEVEKTVHTSVLLAVIGGIFTGLIGFIFAPTFLQWMGIEPSLLTQATLYMRAYFCGIPASLLYNYCASTLRSTGNTTQPLIFLSVSGVVNVVLNLIMVLGFRTGALGVGVATAAAQWVSAAMIVIYMMRTDGPCKLSPKKIRIDAVKLKKIVAIGLPAGFQGSLFSISNVIIQGAIHSFGSATVVAGNTAASNLEGYVYVIMNSIATSALTFTGQHVGANKPRRLKKVILWHCLLAAVLGFAFGGLMFIFGRPLIGIFSPGNEAIADAGMVRIGIFGFTYFMCGVMDVGCSIMRGFGKSAAPTVVSLLGSCLSRIVWIYAVFYPFFSDNIVVLFLSYPITWVITAGVHYICVAAEYKRFKRSTQESEAFTLQM